MRRSVDASVYARAPGYDNRWWRCVGCGQKLFGSVTVTAPCTMCKGTKFELHPNAGPGAELRARENVAASLAARAFEAGFAAGADAHRARRRHAVDPVTHQDWRAGYDAGRAALKAALAAHAARAKGPTS